MHSKSPSHEDDGGTFGVLMSYISVPRQTNDYCSQANAFFFRCLTESTGKIRCVPRAAEEDLLSATLVDPPHRHDDLLASMPLGAVCKERGTSPSFRQSHK
jgi:hypothetical protein